MRILFTRIKPLKLFQENSPFLANSQQINPVTVGWFLQSSPTLADFRDLESVLNALWNVKGGFGLYWSTVKDRKPYNSSQLALGREDMWNGIKEYGGLLT
jgi:hypothetical protein